MTAAWSRWPLWALSLAVLGAHVPSLEAQDSTETSGPPERKTRIAGYPYVYYTPETELAFGVGGLVTFYTSTTDAVLRPSKVTLSGYYSTRKQYKITLAPQLYFAGNHWMVAMPVSFGLFVDKFWGYGNDTPETGTEDYKAEVFDYTLDVQWPPVFHVALRGGMVYELNRTWIKDTLENSIIGSGDLTGSDGGWTSGLGGHFVWDSRDHTFFPHRGALQKVLIQFYFPAIGSDFEFSRWTADFRHYFPVGADGVVAAQLYGEFVTGDPPFYGYPALGGQHRMRGYFYGRYRDKDYVMGQVEFRRHLWRRLGFVAFLGAGDVAPQLNEFRLAEFKLSYGFGLRFLFNQAEKVNLRVDFGFGKDTHGVYFGLEEAF